MAGGEVEGFKFQVSGFSVHIQINLSLAADT